ncbi:helix-turn-helix domain-containing protein [Amycolatopsis thermophila]|uniref:Transcriptional regulator with XRE-family HTH domain n=1 Tax=Amycolatopsis thermophila TaxID=206084 RepID=A0ABU0F4V5_9PSEU|nr:helix-turn-helix transcriptional regulator [Amycolatopsis thermophila]MDQ0382513.1 transcriptional regulator with XRE-family HTH domain [Amycolatopsis thermophila]
MEIAKDIRDFLMTRRAKITPEQAGLVPGPRRRVPGLRREEVARLAGVSTEYYVQIERGQISGVSDEVLHAIARALQLDDVETAHLFDLVRAATRRAGPRTAKPRVPRQRVPDGVQALMDSMVAAPAIVQNGHLDLVGTNALGRALYAGVFERASGTPNLARFIFLDERAAEVFPDWEKAADDSVALLHVEAARSPYSKVVTGLVGELATRSAEFRARWAAHDVRAHRRGTKQFRHPVVGDLTLRFEALEITSAANLTLIGYTAEPGSPSAEALQLLASWIATAPSPPGERARAD